jgi:hypothetical protein
LVSNRLVAEAFDGNEDPNAIANLLDAHFLEHRLVTFDQIAARDMVC